MLVAVIQKWFSFYQLARVVYKFWPAQSVRAGFFSKLTCAFTVLFCTSSYLKTKITLAHKANSLVWERSYKPKKESMSNSALCQLYLYKLHSRILKVYATPESRKHENYGIDLYRKESLFSYSLYWIENIVTLLVLQCYTILHLVTYMNILYHLIYCSRICGWPYE